MKETDSTGNLTQRALELATLEARGRISGVTGPVVRARGVNAVVGQQVDLWSGPGHPPVPAEVIGLERGEVLLMALDNLQGIGPGCEVGVRGRDTLVSVGDGLLGRVIDGLGRPLDGKPLPALSHRRSLRERAPRPLLRKRITTPFSTGVKAVDAMLSVGRGQRVGIFAGAGIGKTTLLSMMARLSDADVCVVGLVGERGREVREFVEDAITPENRSRSVVVAVTGDEAPLTRIRGALLATTVAEYYRSQGRHVLLLVDSLTRFAMALREVGLAGGALPASKGYPPVVFQEISQLVERAGNDDRGSITGIYTVLVEGDDMSEPVSDSTRALLDGHVILSREMANRGLVPPVDVLASRSRLMNHVVSNEHSTAAQKVIAALATYRQAEDLIRIGAYQKGSDPAVDRAIDFVPHFERFIGQEQNEISSFSQAAKDLLELAAAVG